MSKWRKDGKYWTNKNAVMIRKLLLVDEFVLIHPDFGRAGRHCRVFFLGRIPALDAKETEAFIHSVAEDQIRNIPDKPAVLETYLVDGLVYEWEADRKRWVSHQLDPV